MLPTNQRRTPLCVCCYVCAQTKRTLNRHTGVWVARGGGQRTLSAGRQLPFWTCLAVYSRIIHSLIIAFWPARQTSTSVAVAVPATTTPASTTSSSPAWPAKVNGTNSEWADRANPTTVANNHATNKRLVTSCLTRNELRLAMATFRNPCKAIFNEEASKNVLYISETT